MPGPSFFVNPFSEYTLKTFAGLFDSEDSEGSMASDPVRDPFAMPRVRLPAGDRRNQILAAALEIFGEQGFHGTRTRELAERAGVSEALVFHHFPTKEALIRAIFDQVGFEDGIVAIA